MIREYFKHQGFFWTALSHIFSILKWSRTSFSCYGSFSTAVSHASWALGWPGVINLRGCIALILILRFLKRSGTSNSSHGAFSIASLHISWVLRLSGTSYSSHGWMRTASLTFLGSLSHQGQVLKSLVLCALTNSMVHVLKQVTHFIHILRSRRGLDFMDYRKVFYLCFTFITLILRFNAKIYVVGCIRSN